MISAAADLLAPFCVRHPAIRFYLIQNRERCYRNRVDGGGLEQRPERSGRDGGSERVAPAVGGSARFFPRLRFPLLRATGERLVTS